MFSTDDTIVAVATPAGRGGVAMARLSGPGALAVALGLSGRANPLEARHATRVRLAGIDVPDDALLTYFPAPASYTGEDVVEISTHGSPVVMAAVITAATAGGARPARPGEFTLRAFLNGKLDLLQAEAVQDLVSAVSPADARLASGHLAGGLSAAVARLAAALRDLRLRLEASIDFPDEGYRFIDRDAVAGCARRAARRPAGDRRRRSAGTAPARRASRRRRRRAQRREVEPVQRAGRARAGDRDGDSRHHPGPGQRARADWRRSPANRRYRGRASQRRGRRTGGNPPRQRRGARRRSGAGRARSIAPLGRRRPRRPGGHGGSSTVDRRQQGRPGAGLAGVGSRRGAHRLGDVGRRYRRRWPHVWRRRRPLTARPLTSW